MIAPHVENTAIGLATALSKPEKFHVLLQQASRKGPSIHVCVGGRVESS